MGAETGIEWTDHTASPWYGCQHAVLTDGSEHPGCAHCYAEAFARRNPTTLGEWGSRGVRVVSKSFHTTCRKWNALPNDKARSPIVFPSLCDPFEEWPGRLHFQEKDSDTGELVNTAAWWRTDIGVCRAGQTTMRNVRGERLATMADARADLFKTIDDCQNLTFALLTKRPQNVRKMWPAFFPGGYLAEAGALNQEGPRPNVWLGTSVSDQTTAGELLPELLRCRDLAPVLFLSIEPLLGPIDLWRIYAHNGQLNLCALEKLRWVIVGGESGPYARPMHPDWVRSIRDQCVAAGVPFFFKQWGEWVSWENASLFDRGAKPVARLDDACFVRVGKAAAGNTLDGVKWEQYPEMAS